MTPGGRCTLVFAGAPPSAAVIEPLDPLLQAGRLDLLVVAPDVTPYLEMGLRCVAPLLAGPGLVPLIHAALLVAGTEQVVVVDPAAVDGALAGALAAQPEHLDVVLAGPGPGAPVPGRYARRCIRPLERAWRRDPAVDPARIVGLRVRRMSLAAWPRPRPDGPRRGVCGERPMS